MGQLIDGNLVSQKVKLRIRDEVSDLVNSGIQPCLATILVGDNQASATYVKNKQTAANIAGILTRDFRLSKDVSQNELVSIIEELNHDDKVHGILVQLPLQPQIETSITNRVNPEKDVDGLTSHNLGLLLKGVPKLVPCTPLGLSLIHI